MQQIAKKFSMKERTRYKTLQVTIMENPEKKIQNQPFLNPLNPVQTLKKHLNKFTTITHSELHKNAASEYFFHPQFPSIATERK